MTTTDRPHPMRRAAHIMPLHPGNILRDEVLAYLDLPIADVAERMGMPVANLTAILNGTRSITLDDARGIHALCGSGPDVWLRLQAAYDSWRVTHESW